MLLEARGGGVLYIFWVRVPAIGKGIDFHDLGIRNGIDFHDFGRRNGINFRNFHNLYRVGYAFSENWYKVGYIFLKDWYKVGYTFWKNWYKEPARGTALIGNSVRGFFITKGFVRIFHGFLLKTKGFLPKVYEIFWK